MKHVIIGGGPAALSAAATLRQADASAHVTLLCREAFPPYAKMALPYLLAGRIEEKDLFLTPPPGVDILLEQEAVRILTERREVETATGERFPFDRLLVASGASPKIPRIPGADLPFVMTVRDLPDIDRIRKRIKGKTGRAVIAGAGPVGMETGDALAQLGVSLIFVVSSSRILSTMLDPGAAALVAGRLSEAGIEILTGDDITAIRDNGEISLRSGISRMCDLVIFGKGVEPALSFLAGSGIATAEGVIVNEHQETNIPGIYAAGDAAQTRDLVSGEPRVNALWPVAVEQGRVAGLSMAGIPAAYPGSLGRNIMNVFGISIFAAGAGRAEKGYQIQTLEGADFYRKTVLDQGSLKGLIVVGETKNEGLYTALIEKKADVSSYTGSILKGSYGYSRHLARTCRRVV